MYTTKKSKTIKESQSCIASCIYFKIMIIDGKTPLLEIFLSLAEAILIIKILFLLWLCNCIKLKKPSKISLLSGWEWEKFDSFVHHENESINVHLLPISNSLKCFAFLTKNERQKPPVHLHSFFLLFISFKTQVSLKKRNWKMEVLIFPFASLTLFCWEDDTKYYRTRDPEVTLKYKAGHLCSPKLTVQGWAWARGSNFSSSCVLTDLRVRSFLPNCALLSQCIEMTVETSNGPHQALHVLCLKLSRRKVC